jgi:hypothetical protein
MRIAGACGKMTRSIAQREVLMSEEDLIEVLGGHSRALPLQAGQAVKLINTFGTQTVDMWAICQQEKGEFLSVEHTRRMLSRLFPGEGDAFYTNRRNIVLNLERDTAGTRHDMLLACCDSWLYRYYGAAPEHRNCRDNFFEALAALSVQPQVVPNPVNLWMNVSVSDNSRIELTEPVSKAGDFVVLRARLDCYVVFSACPMDISPVNGGGIPKPVHFARLDSP